MSQEFPKFYVTDEYFKTLTESMTELEKDQFINAINHGLMPITRNEHGWWMTRRDLLVNQGTISPLGVLRTAWALVDTEGWLHWNQEFKE